MPGRKIPLINNQIYHVLNKGISLQLTFITKRDYQRALEVMRYYQNEKQPLRYSQFLSLSNERRTQILEDLVREKRYFVEIIAYCLMPNHFHFILKQLIENGISKFLSNFTNSYTRYFNTKNKRTGPLFQGKFKAVMIESDEQLLHLSRYIHLNPYSSHLIKNIKDIEVYPYSSFREYIEKDETNFCDKKLVLDNFKDASSYKEFVLNQADYQKKVDEIRHLVMEG